VEGAILKTLGEHYLRDERIIFTLLKMFFSDAVSIIEDDRIYTTKYLSE